MYLETRPTCSGVCWDINLQTGFGHLSGLHSPFAGLERAAVRGFLEIDFHLNVKLNKCPCLCDVSGCEPQKQSFTGM